MSDAIIAFLLGLQVGLTAGAYGGYKLWQRFGSIPKPDTTVELLRPLVGALVAVQSGEVGPTAMAIQQLTQQSAARAAGSAGTVRHHRRQAGTR